MELGWILKANIHHMYLHSTQLQQIEYCITARRKRRLPLTRADIKLSYCFAVDFSVKPKDSWENQTENSPCGSAF